MQGHHQHRNNGVKHFVGGTNEELNFENSLRGSEMHDASASSMQNTYKKHHGNIHNISDNEEGAMMMIRPDEE